jgi:hypothetical protein
MMHISIKNLSEVQDIIRFVQDHSFDLNIFLAKVNGEVSTQKIDEEHLTTIIRKVSNTISTIIIGSVDSKIKTIAFYGSIQITPKDIFHLFGKFREAYSFKDDLYFYFFNETKEQGNFKLSFFEPSHHKLDIANNESGLDNLFVAWT